MRKRSVGRKFSRDTSSRRALFRALVRAFVENGSIKTTIARAKSLQVQVDRLATIARKNSLASRRQLLAALANDRATTDKLVSKIGSTGRVSGLTRIIPQPARRGDSAAMAIIEWVDKTVDVKKENASEKSKKVSSAKDVKVNKKD